jgi:ubiquinone/menaquinone biosynthesis C-methylase UbiE
MIEKEQFQRQQDEIRENLLKYTRRAFRVLPEMKRPRILDIGCGSGIPTLELARLSQGEVIGIDIDQCALDKFASRIESAGLTATVQVLNLSMFDLNFADESFDIVWSEGAIFAIGFERGLNEWKRLIKPGRFLVEHDEQGNIEEKLELISKCRYELLDYFLLSTEVWRTEYFSPLEKLVNEFQSRYGDMLILKNINRPRADLEMFNNNPERNSSVYFIMKKKD